MGVLIRTYLQSLETNRRVLANRFRYVGMARKVVGVGSVGTRAWIVLMMGRDENDPLLLQVKEAQPSVLEFYLPPSAYENAGERVVVGQRLMQAAGDILLGWLHAVGPDGHEGDYYVRQLRDWKGSANVQSMNAKVLADYGRSCGEVLARAHARTGDRIAIASYLGTKPIGHWCVTPQHMPTRTISTTKCCAKLSPAVAWRPDTISDLRSSATGVSSWRPQLIGHHLRPGFCHPRSNERDYRARSDVELCAGSAGSCGIERVGSRSCRAVAVID
jgi:hypothetical protein